MNFALGMMGWFFITSVLTTEIPSSNYAGLKIGTLPSNETFNAITGTFTVPLPRAPQGSTNGSYGFSIWAGIDYAIENILQAGFMGNVDVQVDGSQNSSYSAWYEWFPLPSE